MKQIIKTFLAYFPSFRLPPLKNAEQISLGQGVCAKMEITRSYDNSDEKRNSKNIIKLYLIVLTNKHFNFSDHKFPSFSSVITWCFQSISVCLFQLKEQKWNILQFLWVCGRLLRHFWLLSHFLSLLVVLRLWKEFMSSCKCDDPQHN